MGDNEQMEFKDRVPDAAEDLNYDPLPVPRKTVCGFRTERANRRK